MPENDGSLRGGAAERIGSIDVATRDSKSSVNGGESADANPGLQGAMDSRRANFMAASVTPQKLHHTGAIEEESSVDGSTSGIAQGNERLARLPSLDSHEGGVPSFNLGVDHSVPAEPGPMGAPATSLQGWNSDLLDLPVGHGGPPNRRKLCLLSLDGGGMRGLIAARILSHLESILQEKVGGGKVKLCDYFDLLAGSSTGAVLATMLVTPDASGEPTFTAEGCCEFYIKNGRYIFQPRWYDPFNGSLRQLYRPKYSARRFEDLLKKYTFVNGKFLTLVDAMKPLVVTSFDISQATPFFFVRQAAQKDPSRNFKLWEVCRATAAAPTYFPPASVRSVDGKIKGTLIDGGAVQNNPALVATTHAMSNNEEFPFVSSLEDVLILSIGAGQMDKKHELDKARKWGMTKWVRPIMDIMMDGTADTVDYQLAAAYAGNNCSENYLRIQLSGLPNKTSVMDCTTQKNIQDLIGISDDLIKQKAIMRNSYGEKVTLDQTNQERLSWFADQLIIQKKLREDPHDSHFSEHPLPKYVKEGLGPAGRLVSPLFAHLFEHKKQGDLGKHAEKARSLRF